MDVKKKEEYNLVIFPVTNQTEKDLTDFTQL